MRSGGELLQAEQDIQRLALGAPALATVLAISPRYSGRGLLDLALAILVGFLPLIAGDVEQQAAGGVPVFP
jgi:hypothetical protein